MSSCLFGARKNRQTDVTESPTPRRLLLLLYSIPTSFADQV